eukprot:2953458-Amphidinium_carterae.1
MLVMDRFDASFERMVGEPVINPWSASLHDAHILQLLAVGGLSCVEESQEEHGYDEHGHSPARDGDDDEDEGTRSSVLGDEGLLSWLVDA